jgi:hypothetical protein
MKRRFTLVAVCLTMACKTVGGVAGDHRACPQTSEFGNTGCFDVIGRVVGTADQPLSGISVGPRYLPGREGFNSPFVTTDQNGRFSLRIQRFGASAPAEGPDTVSLFISAVDMSSAVNGPATRRDSVLVRATIVPVGRLPTPRQVLLRLSVP